MHVASKGLFELIRSCKSQHRAPWQSDQAGRWLPRPDASLADSPAGPARFVRQRRQ